MFHMMLCSIVVRSLRAVPALAMAVALSASPAFGQALQPTTPQQLSVGPNNSVPDSESDELVLSPNSGISAFKSLASNLVANDTNQRADVFIRSAAGEISLATVSSDGVQADAGGRNPALSQVAPNGAYGVVFLSRASNLVAGLTSRELEFDQVYLRLPGEGKTFLISRGYDGSGFVGGLGNSEYPTVVSLDNGAKYLVAFHSSAFNIVKDAVPPADATGRRLKRIFFATLTVATGQIEMGAFTGLKGGAQADGDLSEPVLSGYGDQILFRTNASNLGWTNTGAFVYQVALASKGGGIELISKSPVDGSPGLESSDSHGMSFNATRMVFKTSSSNILSGSFNSPSIVAYSALTKQYSLINSTAAGVRGDSYSKELVRVDPKGRLVVFVDRSSNYLAPGADTNDRDDVFVKDLQTNQIIRVNVGPNGEQEADGYTGGPVLGALGFYSQTATVGFHSSSSILRQVGSGPNFTREVYRSLLKFSFPPLDKDTTLEAPPDVVPGESKLVLTLQKFDTAVKSAARGLVHSLASKVSYEVRLTNTTNNKKLKVISTRNRVIVRNLTPGQYTVRYRVSGLTTEGKKVRTRYSPFAYATVAKGSKSPSK